MNLLLQIYNIRFEDLKLQSELDARWVGVVASDAIAPYFTAYFGLVSIRKLHHSLGSLVAVAPTECTKVLYAQSIK